MREKLYDARALLAVGLDGRFVVLQVDAENIFLAKDAVLDSRDLEAVLKIWPESAPAGPGLYEFRGFSALESLATGEARMVHRGHCSKVAM
jgi:hypothetical protein